MENRKIPQVTKEYNEIETRIKGGTEEQRIPQAAKVQETIFRINGGLEDKTTHKWPRDGQERTGIRNDALLKGG